ncbi:hypothetical protein C8J56DRAFT_887054 [Mycena floridula]|nr:hypothetical protein C8J56DRAFT_887054 [Mycena floridula]
MEEKLPQGIHDQRSRLQFPSGTLIRTPRILRCGTVGSRSMSAAFMSAVLGVVLALETSPMALVPSSILVHANAIGRVGKDFVSGMHMVTNTSAGRSHDGTTQIQRGGPTPSLNQNSSSIDMNFHGTGLRVAKVPGDFVLIMLRLGTS